MNEATFAEILDTVSDGVVIFEQDGSIRYVNRAFCEMTGLAPDEIEHPVFGMAAGPHIDFEVVSGFNAAIANFTEFSREVLAIRKDGEPFWNSFSVKPQCNPDGTHSHFICVSCDVTAQKNAEAKATQLERSYEFIFDNVQAAIAVYDVHGNVRVANQKASEILGISKGNLAGRSIGVNYFRIFRLDGTEILPDDYPVIRALKTKSPVLDNILRYHRDDDGTTMWFVCSAFPVIDSEGRVLEVLLSFADISRLIESEEATRQFQERFELAARATQDAIFDWNVQTGEMWGNEAYASVYGYPAPTVMTLDALESTSGVVADHKKVRQTVLDAINSDSDRYAFDYEFTRQDGTSGHVAVRAFIVRDAQGKAQRIIGTATNIAQLTRANAALEQSETRFRLIADTASDVLWDHDFETGFTWSSPDWPAKLGVNFDPRDTQNFKWVEGVNPSDRPRLIASFVEAIKSNVTRWESEFKAYDANGQWIELAIKAVILRHPDGRASRILGNMRNVTEEKRTREGFTRARALEAVGQLTGGVAHDFNNLLMIILGNAELLEMGDLGEEEANTVMAISQAAESAAKLTRRLLTFARQAQLNTTRVEVGPLVAETLTLLRAGLPETVRLSYEVAPDLWDVDVDANSLEQAIVNLAMNANDAMPRGGEIMLNCTNLDVDDDMIPANADLRPGRYVSISVSDTGEGMPAEVLARAFEPFFTTKEVGKGTGLGLSTVYGFAKQSHGGVSIYSEPGHGTTVTIYLAAAAVAHHPDAVPEIQPESITRRRRILVVEDQPQVREHVERTLTKLGYDVTTAPDAARALVILKDDQRAFDLLFTDIIMPGGMNGQELGEAALAFAPHLKVLYTSGYPAAAFQHLGLEEQSSLNFLPKPYKSSQLREKIARIFN